jgi:hypothetical protein
MRELRHQPGPAQPKQRAPATPDVKAMVPDIGEGRFPSEFLLSSTKISGLLDAFFTLGGFKSGYRYREVV